MPLDAPIDQMRLLDLFSQDVTTWHASSEACIEEYTKRDLSYDSDTLNACLGVLNTWANPSALLPRSVRSNLWGLTIYASELRLAWHHPKPGTRRPEFPSWSWVGSKGPITFHYNLTLYNTGDIQIGYKTSTSGGITSLRLDTGQVTSWTDSYKYFSDPQASDADICEAPRLLRLSSLCVRFDLFYDSLKQVWFGLLPGRPGFRNKVYMDYIIPGNTNHSGWLAMLVRNGTGYDASRKLQFAAAWQHGGVFLLLKPADTLGAFERVGLMVADKMSTTFPDHDNWPQPVSFQHTVVIM